jgi:autophagy-related protein 2
MLNDLWTPDVKATQLADVISGVSPIRSVVNVGSGVADLVLLPIAQYRKDGRVVRGLQKGTKAFVRSTAMEAVKLGAHLATGTQVILEQAENVLGSGFGETILVETVSHPSEDAPDTVVHDWALDGESADPISRYAEQPSDIREGIQSAYTSIRQNLSSAAQTILAVPMEVFERSGSEVRSRIRIHERALTYHHLGTCSCCDPSDADCRLEAHDWSKRSSQQDLTRASKHHGP